MIPTPLRVSVRVGVAVMVNALAPGLNTIRFTSVSAEIETSVTEDESKVVVSDAPII